MRSMANTPIWMCLSSSSSNGRPCTARSASATSNNKNLFHSVTLDDDIDPSHSYAPNLPGSLSDLCGHDEWR